MKMKTVFLAAAMLAGSFGYASASCQGITVNAPGGQQGNVVQCDPASLTNLNNLLNGGLSNSGSLELDSLAGAGSLTAGATFSTGFVSTPDGLNSAAIQAVGLTETNASASGSGLGENVNGTMTGSTLGAALSDTTSYSGSLVQGTGTAWNITGGGSVGIGGGFSLQHAN